MSVAAARATPETLEQAIERLTMLPRSRGALLEALHTYTDRAGTPIYHRIRMRMQDGDKWIRPICLVGGEYELKEPPHTPHGKPLYRLHEVAAADEVIVCEGEWCADHLATLGLSATTSGGSSSADKADWSPLAGKRVIIWPDNDDAGARYAASVAQAAWAAGALSVEIIQVPRSSPIKGDAVDWLTENAGATATDVLKLPRVPVAQAVANAAAEATVALICAADVVPQPIDWLWYEYLAQGKLQILAGAPGAGKSSIACALAAAVSSSGRWPDGTPAPVGDVVIWSGEDSAGDTIIPRLHACEADVNRVHIINEVRAGKERRSFDPAEDMDALREALLTLGRPVRLLVVDPIVSAVSGDSHKNAEVRRGLQALVDLAEQVGCVVLGITHFTKGTAGKNPVERVTGSLAFGALARIVLVAVKLPSVEGAEAADDCRALMRAKSNIGPDNGGFYYTLDRIELSDYPGIRAQRVTWGEAVEGSAHDLLNDAEGVGGGRKVHAREVAEAFLRAVLKDGPVASVEVAALAKAKGICERTLSRARQNLGVQSEKNGLGKWMQSLHTSTKIPKY